MRKPSIRLLSAYSSDSHACWADWLCNNLGEFSWQRLELPGRHFRWRIRGNPLSWMDSFDATAPDLLIATSMVDLATIKGLQPQLSAVPAVYYFHENQFAYPRGENQVRSVEPQMVQLYGALASDLCVFNSEFNRSSFIEGIDALLAKMPDHVPTGLSRTIERKSLVLPVPVTAVSGETSKSPLLLWNHRWEYDKAPELFVDAVLQLAAEGIDFELALLGQRPQQTPAALQRLREALPDRIRHDGKLPTAEYHRVLADARLVISTARHEFQGLAMLEAVSAGALPIVPDALCYPEQYPPQFRYRPDDAGALAAMIRNWLDEADAPAPDISPWLSTALHPRWQQLVESQLETA